MRFRNSLQSCSFRLVRVRHAAKESKLENCCSQNSYSVKRNKNGLLRKETRNGRGNSPHGKTRKQHLGNGNLHGLMNGNGHPHKQSEKKRKPSTLRQKDEKPTQEIENKKGKLSERKRKPSQTFRKEIEKHSENFQKGNGNPHKLSERKSISKTIRKEMETLTKDRKGNRKRKCKLSERKLMETLTNSRKGHRKKRENSQRGNGNPHSQKGNGNTEKWQH